MSKKQVVNVNFKEAEKKFLYNTYLLVDTKTGRFTSKIPTYGTKEDLERHRVILLEMKE